MKVCTNVNDVSGPETLYMLGVVLLSTSVSRVGRYDINICVYIPALQIDFVLVGQIQITLHCRMSDVNSTQHTPVFTPQRHGSPLQHLKHVPPRAPLQITSQKCHETHNLMCITWTAPESFRTHSGNYNGSVYSVL